MGKNILSKDIWTAVELLKNGEKWFRLIPLRLTMDNQPEIVSVRFGQTLKEAVDEHVSKYRQLRIAKCPLARFSFLFETRVRLKRLISTETGHRCYFGFGYDIKPHYRSNRLVKMLMKLREWFTFVI